MGLRVERGALGSRARIEERPALVFPLESSVVTLSRSSGADERLDRASFAVVPPHARFRVRTTSAVCTLVTLTIGARAIARAAREYRGHVEGERLSALLTVPRVLSRTRWVDELVHRYVFERDECQKHDSSAARFLETELTKEVYFLCREREELRTRASVLREEATVVARARAWIDAHLASPVSVVALASHCHVSESTLLRAFARELGETPGSYARGRRLDAGLMLLESGSYSVGEVATRVGYASLAAFTGAFHRRFGAPPSSVRKGEASLARLPPEGAAPRRKRRSV